MTEPRKDHHERLLASIKKRTRRRLAECPPSWQLTLQSELLRRENRGRKAGTNVSWAQAWHTAGMALGDRKLPEVPPEEWEVLVNRWITEPQGKGKPFERSYAATICTNLKQTLGRFYASGVVPEPVRRALHVSIGTHRPKGRVLSKDEFILLLDHANTGWGATHSPKQRALATALLWMLWDSWMRSNELLGLSVGDVEENGDHAVLRMRPGLFQKRGPRPVKVMEGLPALRLWLAVHPAAGDPKAPLFCNFRSPDGLDRMSDTSLDHYLKLWGERSGLHGANHREKKLSAHDFRHTGNTRAARDRWPRTLRTTKAGWTPTSRMAEHYEHLDDEDMLEQMRRDAGINHMSIPQTHGLDDATRLAILEQQRQTILDRLAKKAKAQPSPGWREK